MLALEMTVEMEWGISIVFISSSFSRISLKVESPPRIALWA
jgi:hypothetical protein